MISYVYILGCNNGRYYVGSTSDLLRRFEEHCQGKNKATQNVLPVTLLFSQKFPTLKEARQIEYKLKKWKSRELLNRIIHEGYIKSSVG